MKICTTLTNLVVFSLFFHLSLAQNATPNTTQISPIYQETFEGNPADMLQGQLFTGTDDMWDIRIADGRYVFSNQQDQGAVYYHYLGDLNGDAASVDVMGQFGNAAGAGLLYRFDPERRHYFAFLITGPDAYAFYKRADEGLQVMLEGNSSAIRPEGNRLILI